YNENYQMLPMPKGAEEGILKGLYLLQPSEMKGAKLRAQLLGSGPILHEVLKAQKTLAENYNVSADVWSLTSLKELRRDAMEADRFNLLHPTEKPRVPYVSQCLNNTDGVIVSSSDYVKILPDALQRWVNRPMYNLGTEGYGRSETRERLRDFFEIDARFITLATLSELVRKGDLKKDVLSKAIHDLGIDPAKRNPLTD
ncbi:MAG: pyruvate dehydrogenase (acetyl-transferring), homodimeric type, partial [Kiritimatiellae bacterium]|nr:pyruvate dehydrogenase (acetyl-transferring), homodimeric type [Kiritimatiellia bacterium]